MRPSFLNEELQQPRKRSLPYPVLKIRHPVPSAGVKEVWVIEDNGSTQELSSVIDFYIIAERGQYFKFDPIQNRTTILSEILPTQKIRSAIDLKSGKPISELKEKEDLTFVSILFGLVKVGKDWVPVISYFKKSSLKELITIKEEVGGVVIGKKLELGLKVLKNGAVVYAVPILKGAKEDLPVSDDLLTEYYNNFRQAVAEYNMRDENDANSDAPPVEF